MNNLLRGKSLKMYIQMADQFFEKSKMCHSTHEK